MYRQGNKTNPLPVWPTPIIIGSVAGIAMALSGTERKSDAMSTEGIIAIVVALIGVIGSVLLQWYQFKKDSNTIGDVKSDTSEMKPTVNLISKNVDKIADSVAEKIVPTMDQVNRFSESSSAGLKELVDNLHYQQRLMGETSFSIDRDYFIMGIEKLYTENARLSAETKRLTMENAKLRGENRHLKMELAQYVPRSRSQDHSDTQGYEHEPEYGL